MKIHLKVLKKHAVIWIGIVFFCQSALADPIWHCSRSDIQVADASDDFNLASLSLEREVIRLSLRDLLSVYQGLPVQMTGNLQLSACVVGSNAQLTSSALRSIGSSSALVKAIASSSNLSKSNIFIVQDEQSMVACIQKHHPAIGYLSKATHTEAIGPCF
jgi:hypothetical protein